MVQVKLRILQKGIALLCCLLVCGLMGCHLQMKEKPSFLILAVDSLGFEDAACSAGKSDRGGLSILCEESVRFTHAYTPSVMGQASLASLLTGRYPHEHGVWHNGSKAMSNQIVTVPEVAIESGLRTSFFSGGPPYFGKTNVRQGFEIFDDAVRVERAMQYRPAKEVNEAFLRWLTRDVKNEAFFSVLTYVDLQFPDIVTTDDFGEVRNTTVDSQIQEIDESLAHLFLNLKRLKRWDSTYVILVGLNGRSHVQRKGELAGSNLFSENTLVALFVKNAQNKRDQGMSWNIDRNVSLVDVGVTLYELMGAPFVISAEREKIVQSLASGLHGKSSGGGEDRLVLLESAWPEWKENLMSRFAARLERWLVMFDKDLRVYNTFADRMETTPTVGEEIQVKSLIVHAENFFSKKGFVPWVPMPKHVYDKYEFARQLLDYKNFDLNAWQAKLYKLLEQRPWDAQLRQWIAWLSVKKNNWPFLQKIGHSYSNAIWQYVALRNMNIISNWPQHNCFELLDMRKKISEVSLQSCEDTLFLMLVAWVRAKDLGLDEANAREQFIRQYWQTKVDEIIELRNLNNGNIWDVAPRNLEASNTDLALALPELQEKAFLAQRRFELLP